MSAGARRGDRRPAGRSCAPWARASPESLLPFLRALEDSVAHAAGETPPLRFVTMYHPHGIAAETWVMRGADTETSFDLTFTEPMSGAIARSRRWRRTSRGCWSSRGSICCRTRSGTTRREPS